jgi:hypothetical protein
MTEAAEAGKNQGLGTSRWTRNEVRCIRTFLLRFLVLAILPFRCSRPVRCVESFRNPLSASESVIATCTPLQFTQSLEFSRFTSLMMREPR